MRVCSKCIYDERIPYISFDANGVCNFCHQIEQMKELYGTGSEKGRLTLEQLLDRIKADGKGRQYDCVIGVSGGTDSSYLLMKAVDWGLRPLAVHYDNTWNTAVATENIRKITSAFSVDLHTHVLDNAESEDIYRSFLLAGVPEFDASTDMALVQTIRSAAAKAGIKYILEGHSFVAEGISPLGSTYIDGGYVADVHRRFGTRKLKTYPHLSFLRFLKWVLLYRQNFIRPLWYIDYSKAQAQKELSDRTGWINYSGHHLENRASAFSHTVNRPLRFNQDLRYLSLAAQVRSGQLSREAALDIYGTPLVPDPELVNYVKKRLGFSDSEYESLMSSPTRTSKDFRNYKKYFEILRPLFYALAKQNKVPMSFYLKYCFPLVK